MHDSLDGSLGPDDAAIPGKWPGRGLRVEPIVSALPLGDSGRRRAVDAALRDSFRSHGIEQMFKTAFVPTAKLFDLIRPLHSFGRVAR